MMNTACGKLALAITSLLLLAALLPGCDIINGNIIPAQSTTPFPTDTPTPLLSVELSFPEGAPPLNQTAILKCTVNNRHVPMKNMTLNVELPDAFELVNGLLSWSGTVSAGNSVEVINVVVRSVKVGNWTINVPYHITSIPVEYYSGDGNSRIYVMVSENSAKWALYPVWFEGQPPGTVPVTTASAK